MSLARCIPGLLAEGKLTAEQAERARAVYEQRVRHHARGMGAAAAEAIASEETVKALAAEAARTKRLKLITRQVQKDRLTDLARYNAGADGPLAPTSAAALIAADSKAPYLNVEGLRRAIKGEAHAEIDGILADHRRTLTGALRNRAQMDEIGRALFGETDGVGVAARELADAWSRVAEMLRQRFNAAGGNIAKLERWGLPQSHDPDLVRRAGSDAWIAAVWDRLDRTAMIDEDTGLPFTDLALELALRDVYETISTDGLVNVTPGTAVARSLANRRAEHRFLHFKSYEDWAAYQAEFGAGTAFDAMMGHIEAMSRDVAAMEILGPNPEATIRWLGDSIEKQAALFGTDPRSRDRAFAGRRQLQRLWDEYRGALRRPENRRLALGFGAVRSVQTAAKLGSATLSAVGDLGTQWVARRFNGLPATSTIGEYVKLLNPASDADRRFAVRRGLIAEEWASMTAAQNRYLAEELTGEVASRLAEGTLRLSGLTAWTQAGRWAFGMEFLDTLQGQFGKRLAELEPALRRTLERYGFTAADWDLIRATEPSLEHKGELFFRPQDVADQRLGDRLLAMVLTETDYAVPVADLRTRAMMNSIAPKGTIPGELARSALLFKSFGISVLINHGRRALEQPSVGGKLGYAAGLTIATMTMGALAVQLKEVAKGKDPRPMGSPEFVAAATLQGGGWGIFGDFFGAAENRFGGGFAQTLAGPVVQTAQNVGDATIGNAGKAARGEKTDVGRDVAKIVRQELPGSSIWYLRLAFNRYVADQLQAQIDPDFDERARRMERDAEDQGQQFFWAPGDYAPSRAPNFATAFEGAPDDTRDD
jgi:hypothetical protein